MQLSYRGIPYTSNPEIIETVESDVTAHFLGMKYQVRHPVQSTVATSRQSLKYRGMTY